MNVVLLREEITPDARPDESDVLQQAAAVARALAELGHRHGTVALAGDADATMRAVKALRPDVVINLVESHNGRGQGVDLMPSLLEAAGLPFTGSGSVAMATAASKLTTKELLVARGLPTPHWLTWEQLRNGARVPPGRYIIKSVWEHGSLGLEDDCVVDALESRQLLDEIGRRRDRLGGAAFAESYVHGREFNLGLLARQGEVQHLPAAEIRFGNRHPARAWIVGYRAKWSSGSEQDVDTPRTFDITSADSNLVAEMQRLARSVWDAFGLAGYARVDLRVDGRGSPWIIDVNTNPCLSPDAGFAAALEQAGIPFPAAIERILAAAMQCHL